MAFGISASAAAVLVVGVILVKHEGWWTAPSKSEMHEFLIANRGALESLVRAWRDRGPGPDVDAGCARLGIRSVFEKRVWPDEPDLEHSEVWIFLSVYESFGIPNPAQVCLVWSPSTRGIAYLGRLADTPGRRTVYESLQGPWGTCRF